MGSWHLCQTVSALELVLGQAWGQAFPGLSCKSCDVASFLFSLIYISLRQRLWLNIIWLSDVFGSWLQAERVSSNKAIYSSLPAFRRANADEVAVSSKVVKQFCLTWLVIAGNGK